MKPSSTLLLLKVFRLRLALCAAAAAALMFALVACARWDNEFPGIAFLLTLLVGLLRMHTRIYEMPFPVSDRQAAWLPIGAMGLVWLAALAGMVLGLPFSIVRGHAQAGQAAADIIHWLRWLPASAFALLFMLRLVQYNFGFIGFLGMAPQLFISQVKSQHSVFAAQVGGGWWPALLLAGSLFLIWEAPEQWGMLRRLNVMPNSSFVKVVVWDLTGPRRIKWRTRLADMLMFTAGIALLILCLRPLAPLAREALKDPALYFSRNPYLLFFLFLLVIPVVYIRVGWRRYRACGYGPLASVLLLLLPFPISGLGRVGQGSVTRCGFCGRYKFAWQARCPHCQEAGEGTPVARREACLKEKRIFIAATDPVLMIYRIIIPLQLLMLALMVNAPRWLGR